MTLVAISAAYGAGGSRVAPMLAQQLGVPFIDRALPMDTAAQVDFPTDEDDPQAGWLERVLKGFVGAEASVKVTFPASGELVFFCRFHKDESGMVGVLRVAA